jgi:hypothetical protein
VTLEQITQLRVIVAGERPVISRTRYNVYRKGWLVEVGGETSSVRTVQLTAAACAELGIARTDERYELLLANGSWSHRGSMETP